MDIEETADTGPTKISSAEEVGAAIVNTTTTEIETITATEVSSSLEQAGITTETKMAVDGTAEEEEEQKNNNNSKTLKRCLSVPILRAGGPNTCSTSMTTRSAAAAAMALRNQRNSGTPKKNQNFTSVRDTGLAGIGDISTGNNFSHNIHIGIPRSNPSSREVSPAPVFNIFAPRARRYSASYTPHGVAGAASGGMTSSTSGLPLCLTPRVSQLRQEECVDMLNSREANHEREVHSAMQMSQSWEDLTLVAENWSCKSEELSNPLQVSLPPTTGVASCSSPSPTSNRAGMRLPYGLSPSPTRRTFATRRSMSPIAMRPSQLGPVKRKFELDESGLGTGSNWNVYSQPPLKKIFTESRGSSPICQSPSSICPSPDSGTYDGRITPKLFVSKLCTNNTNNNNSSACSSPSSSVSGGIIDSTTTSSGICSSSASSTTCLDEGISLTEDDKLMIARRRISTTNNNNNNNSNNMPAAGGGIDAIQPMSSSTTDIMMQDDATLLDDIKSETSSIGGCSSISIESSSCDSASKAAATFLNRLNVDDISITTTTSPLAAQKSFYINKQGLRGHKKYIVSSSVGGGGSGNSSCSELSESINVSSTSVGTVVAATTAAAAPAASAKADAGSTMAACRNSS